MNAPTDERDVSASPLIAVVDDNLLLLKMLRYFLPSKGYRVVTWTRAAGAAAMIEREQPALVLLDMRMEHERAGMDVLHALRDQPGTEGIPVLFVSAWADSLTSCEWGEIRASGGDTMLKPFEFEDLLRKLRDMMAAGR